MSYYMHIGEEDFNITYNVSPMFYAAMPDRGIRCHYGMTGADALFPLRRMREYMEDNREELEAMNPASGWGDYDTALQFVTDLINASIRNADQIWDGD